MTTRDSIAILSKIDCDKLIDSAVTIDGEIYYTNPITNKKIKKTADTFRKIIKHCDGITNTTTVIPKKPKYNKITKDIVDKWITNPLIDPLTAKNISVSLDIKSEYVKLYDNCYKFLKEVDGLSHKDIKEILPKNHLLLNNIDILYYKYNQEELNLKTHSNNDFNNRIVDDYYSLILKYLRIGLDKKLVPILDYINLKNYKKEEILIIANIIYDITDCLNNYFISITNILSINYNNFDHPHILLTIKRSIYQLKNILIPFMEITKLNDEIDSYIKKIIKTNNDYIIIRANKLYYNDTIKNEILQSDNIPLLILNYLTEVLKIVNYKNDPTNSPFDNLENKQFKEIEDPLISILEQIGVKNIDVATLELPKRSFKDDDEYNTYYSKYNKLKNSYEKKRLEWNNIANNDSISPPKRPTMVLPNGKTINVVINKFPKYIKDEEYNTILQTYNKNKKTINMYKELIDIGVFNLLERIDVSPNASPQSITDGLLNKDREYFENNILDIGDDNKMKCNSNTDAISQDEFDDKKYLLAKLQLMYKLYTRNDNNEIIRTDCFYAPTFYNYIVSKVNNKETIINPITKIPITEDDINRLMKIMKIVSPFIERPIYLKPIHDKELQINNRQVTLKGVPYYNVYISRKIGHFNALVYDVCYIPADIEVSETGSTDIASTVFLFSIYKLFNEGKLLNTYMPPYYIDNRNYIKPLIHFNNYKKAEMWDKPRTEVIRMFKHYLEEVKKYL